MTIKTCRKALSGLTLGAILSVSAPVIPNTEYAIVWWEPEKGADVCFARYPSAAVISFSCEDYWKIANTPYEPQPTHTTYSSLFQPYKADAAIAVDNSSNAGGANTASSFSFSHTVNTSDNTILIVGTGGRDAANDNDCLTSSVTYNSVAMDFVRADEVDSASFVDSSLWRMVNPPSGSSLTVTVTNGGTCNESATADSFTGVDQSSPIDAQNGAGGSTALATTTVTTVAADAWLYSVAVTTEAPASDILPGGQTEIIEISLASDNYNAGRFGPRATAGTHGIGWSWTGAEDWAISAISLKPATGGGGGGGTPVNTQRSQMIWFD